MKQQMIFVYICFYKNLPGNMHNAAMLLNIDNINTKCNRIMDNIGILQCKVTSMYEFRQFAT